MVCRLSLRLDQDERGGGGLEERVGCFFYGGVVVGAESE